MCMTQISINGDLVGETVAMKLHTVDRQNPDPLLLGACEVNSAVTTSHFVHCVFYVVCILA